MGQAKITIERPMPPAEVLGAIEGVFVQAPEVEAWLRATFLHSESPLYNVEHDHLNSAIIGVLWTNVENSRHMRGIVGQAEIPFPQGGKWQKERALFQLRHWFGVEPDFVLTFDANYAAEAGDIEWCAIVDHELYHCAQSLDQYGFPKFSKETGRPKFAMRGHDVQEFIGVVRRYGAVGSGVREMVEAANEKPLFSVSEISTMCGTCLAR